MPPREQLLKRQPWSKARFVCVAALALSILVWLLVVVRLHTIRAPSPINRGTSSGRMDSTLAPLMRHRPHQTLPSSVPAGYYEPWGEHDVTKRKGGCSLHQELPSAPFKSLSLELKAYPPQTAEEAFAVDVVYTHVDGSRPQWRRALQRAVLLNQQGNLGTPGAMQGESQYRDWGELRVSLRLLRAKACWDAQTAVDDCGGMFIRRVFLVVSDDDQVPRWLRRGTNRTSLIVIVTHAQLAASAELGSPVVLPTFNANAIETLLPFIPGLGEYFLFLNNDMFIAGGSGGEGGKLHALDLFEGPLERKAGGSVLLKPAVFAERLDENDECLLVQNPRHACPPRFVCRADPAPFRQFVNRNKRLISEAARNMDAVPRLAFAHLPRLFHSTSLRKMLEVSFANATAATRQQQFRTPHDVFVPFLYSHFVSLLMNADGIERARHRSGAVGRLQAVDLSVGPADSDARLVLGWHGYWFKLLRSAEDCHDATREVQALPQSKRPNFITLNDNFESRQFVRGGSGSRVSSMSDTTLKEAMSGLLTAVGGAVPLAEWEREL